MPAGLTRDAVIIDRPTGGSGTDRYGRATTVLSRVYDGRGTWGTPTPRDREFAAKMGMVVDAVFATTYRGARRGDELTTRGSSWRIEAVMDVRSHHRLLMQHQSFSRGFGSFARGFAA